MLSSKFSELEKIEFLRSIEEKTLNSNFLTEDYVDRLSRIKNFNHIKEILESKIVIVRVDLEPFDPVYEEVKNEEGIVIDKVFKHIDFARAKDVVLPISVNQFIDNRAKLVILIASYGPRAGVYNEKYSMDHFIKYLQRVIEYIKLGNNCRSTNNTYKKRRSIKPNYKDRERRV